MSVLFDCTRDSAVEQNRHKCMPSSSLLLSRGVDSKDMYSYWELCGNKQLNVMEQNKEKVFESMGRR